MEADLEIKAINSILKQSVKSEDSIDSKLHVINKPKLKKSSTKWERLSRVKPEPLDRECERHLVVAATRGVVQLFNAIKGHQTDVNKQIVEAKTVRKTEKTLKSLKKGRFFDKLAKPAPTKVKNEQSAEVKSESRLRVKNLTESDDKTTTKKKWGVLTDDFLTTEYEEK